ncbi:peptidylprolyl isomerase [Luteimonas sp. MC1750]|uniref:peptidylprolyl isomerase n=1 Tax=Luteimonas sp. MC1750 TaxID=2799326 RepID=UPI0018F0F638|nr:peptidylprolyl isomerase [Luteimonas sp. MC1750]MBJ6983768.1 peptidylprolyl isomerase [Luteimonas sp. MC1750]QQO07198.1 peptidylprolyl isomerase [Luteimonas sp. MC1750]
MTASAAPPDAATAAATTPAAETAGSAARAPTTQELLEASRPADWRRPDPANTLYMELEGGRVVIELAPDFAPEHVANIRTLAKQGFWDGLTIYRAQDNFVVQFGDLVDEGGTPKPTGAAKTTLPAEFARPAEGLAFHALPDRDGWAPETGFAAGFPAARDPESGLAWLTHCYGTLGAGRDTAPDSSTGTELYVVIGQAPRQLDRNITQVGRVLQGMELLSALPRGSGPLGFHEDAALRTPIRAVRLASEVPASERSELEVLRTDTPLFDAVVESRRNRRDGWYLQPAGHIDLCNISVPVRAAK